MPQINELKYGRDIGYKGRSLRYIWYACEDCGKERWVFFARGEPTAKYCVKCFNKGDRNAGWKGGKRNKDGYKLIKLQPNDFFFPMAECDGYVMEHRLVMAKHLGRCLQRWEIVHHKRGIAKNDNRIKGLQLVSEDRHNQITIMERRITFLEDRVTLLEAENVVLRAKHPEEVNI